VLLPENSASEIFITIGKDSKSFLEKMLVFSNGGGYLAKIIL
jgi:hypothetical protein